MPRTAPYLSNKPLRASLRTKPPRLSKLSPGSSFFVDGYDNSRQLRLDLVDNANVGLAPGTAFGPGGVAGMRLCFARKSADLEEAVARMQRALGTA